MNDWMLVSAYVQGDEGAFESLVRKYFRMVYAMAVRHAGDPHLAEEVAQSVFIILSRKAGKLSSSVSVCGWLMQTTRFVCRDAVKMRLRRQQNEQEFAASLDLNSPTNANPDSIEAMLDEALMALPANEQAGVMAHYFEGKNFKEIGGMLAISEDGAQKRVSRSVAKLRAFLLKRGTTVSATAFAGLLMAQFAREAAAEALSSAIQTARAAAKGEIAAGKALALANHATRLLGWRSAVSLSLKAALVVVLAAGGAWEWMGWSIPSPAAFKMSDARIETLGKAWSQMVLQFASLKKAVAEIPPGDPRFQQLLKQADTFGKEATRISSELSILLTPPQDRDRVAEFLTVEIGETLKLNPSEKLAFHSFVRDRLAQGATLTGAMKAMTQDLPAEVVQIKAMLSPEERERFDSIYGPDGSGFWDYLKMSAARK
jgi:RNA polymerase sigma factor (sigma-70 family)